VLHVVERSLSLAKWIKLNKLPSFVVVMEKELRAK
jgi:hypothetical protein